VTRQCDYRGEGKLGPLVVAYDESAHLVRVTSSDGRLWIYQDATTGRLGPADDPGPVQQFVIERAGRVEVAFNQRVRLAPGLGGEDRVCRGVENPSEFIVRRVIQGGASSFAGLGHTRLVLPQSRSRSTNSIINPGVGVSPSFPELKSAPSPEARLTQARGSSQSAAPAARRYLAER
jgi:hypothetical protein